MKTFIQQHSTTFQVGLLGLVIIFFLAFLTGCMSSPNLTEALSPTSSAERKIKAEGAEATVATPWGTQTVKVEKWESEVRISNQPETSNERENNANRSKTKRSPQEGLQVPKGRQGSESEIIDTEASIDTETPQALRAKLGEWIGFVALVSRPEPDHDDSRIIGESKKTGQSLGSIASGNSVDVANNQLRRLDFPIFVRSLTSSVEPYHSSHALTMTQLMWGSRIQSSQVACDAPQGAPRTKRLQPQRAIAVLSFRCASHRDAYFRAYSDST